MKAPIYQRAEMLNAVIDCAVQNLSSPIDSIAFVSGQFVVRAGQKHIVLECRYSNDATAEGLPIPGGGHWAAYIVGDSALHRRGAGS